VKRAAPEDLASYLARFVDWAERLAISFVGLDDALVLGRERGGAFVIDLEGRLPTAPGTPPAELEVFERWRSIPGYGLARVESKYELRHLELDYRRAFHHHDEPHFLRQFNVATHEHCEATMGVEVCAHYFGYPARDAFDAVTRLYDVWLSGAKPDCSALRCLG
jgi:hypothetical protein